MRAHQERAVGDQGRLVHDIAPRCVDQERVFLHPPEAIGVHEMASLRGGGTMQRDEISLGQHLLYRRPLLGAERSGFFR